MYCFLGYDNFEDKKYFYFVGTLYAKNNELVKNYFNDGKIHEEIGAPFKLILNEANSSIKNKKYTDLIGALIIGPGRLFIVSPKAQTFFQEEYPNDVMLYDVEIVGSNFELKDYKIAKIVNKIDCVDIEKSNLRYDANRNRIKRARTIVLKEDSIPADKEIFLMGPTSDTFCKCIIHESFKKKLEASDLTGFAFYELDNATEA